MASTKNLGDRVEIRIRDNGTGMTPEVKEKMFNPFFTTKPTGEGTGLGLSISHDIIVKQHAGAIEVDTELGSSLKSLLLCPALLRSFEIRVRHSRCPLLGAKLLVREMRARELILAASRCSPGQADG
jgi:signal transduction histidine kinase